MAIDREALGRMADQLPVGRDPHSVRWRIEAMETLLERMFVVPVIGRPVGLDALIGLVPVLGDVVTTAMGAWLVWEARNLGMSKFHLVRMVGNVGIDTAVGAIPVVGDLFDFAFRSNSRNMKMIKRYLDKHHPAARTIEGEVTGRG